MRFCKKRVMPGSETSMQAEDIHPFDNYARIVTGAKFGCIHHEPKNTPGFVLNESEQDILNRTCPK